MTGSRLSCRDRCRNVSANQGRKQWRGGCRLRPPPVLGRGHLFRAPLGRSSQRQGPPRVTPRPRESAVRHHSATSSSPWGSWENGIQGSAQRKIWDIEEALSRGVGHWASGGRGQGQQASTFPPRELPAPSQPCRGQPPFSESWYNRRPEQSANVGSYPNRETEAGPGSQGGGMVIPARGVLPAGHVFS